MTNGDHQCVWFGNNPIQGVAAVSSGEWRVEPGPVNTAVPHSVYPVRVFGPRRFNMLVVWAQRHPSYVANVMCGLDQYGDFIRECPSVVIGDFSHWRWDRRDPEPKHSALIARLKSKFGLVSAYLATAKAGAPQPPTEYWMWKQDRPYHVDYAFIPVEWVPRVRAVEIGGYDEWAKESDHRPVLVEVDDSGCIRADEAHHDSEIP